VSDEGMPTEGVGGPELALTDSSKKADAHGQRMGAECERSRKQREAEKWSRDGQKSAGAE